MWIVRNQNKGSMLSVPNIIITNNISSTEFVFVEEISHSRYEFGSFLCQNQYTTNIYPKISKAVLRYDVTLSQYPCASWTVPRALRISRRYIFTEQCLSGISIFISPPRDIRCDLQHEIIYKTAGSRAARRALPTTRARPSLRQRKIQTLLYLTYVNQYIFHCQLGNVGLFSFLTLTYIYDTISNLIYSSTYVQYCTKIYCLTF